uniref:Uncharacterized protein n=1 Tax=Junco hyemalis TaxID=40217 RepID=A0A8C5J183_JUNHY
LDVPVALPPAQLRRGFAAGRAADEPRHLLLVDGLLVAEDLRLLGDSWTYLTHEAKGSDDAPDADTAIINAEGGQAGGDDKKEYFI